MRTGAGMALLVAAAIGLGGCQNGGVWANVPIDDSPDAQACRVEAENDPEAKRLADSVSSANWGQDQIIRQQLLALLPRLWTTCMQRRGAIRGGVERVRRVTF
ncbi:hypothetical protein KPL78_22265 [Roseomonas sp. HJA6]|uniref:Uncharacterized protein n=1 Tax=Roseomonas alba TaxID=2846776 RepID=A0ABS7AE72_9PROT|nr:hypothetical protein [Neoroseomonas alba]MBW6400600.1 hypothetical protein [Neoroseomonas alba]